MVISRRFELTITSLRGWLPIHLEEETILMQQPRVLQAFCNAALASLMVEAAGDDPATAVCKTTIFPVKLCPHIYKAHKKSYYGLEPYSLINKSNALPLC